MALDPITSVVFQELKLTMIHRWHNAHTTKAITHNQKDGVHVE